MAIVARVENQHLFFASERSIDTILLTIFHIKALGRIEKLVVNGSRVERHNLVLFDDLVNGLSQVISLTIDQTHGKVFGPLARAEDPQDAHDDGQVVVLLNDLLPRIIRRLRAGVC